MAKGFKEPVHKKYSYLGYLKGDPSGRLLKPGEIGNKNPGRNELCPCGSGKKFKKCCRE